jgi:hypothetical protein
VTLPRDDVVCRRHRNVGNAATGLNGMAFEFQEESTRLIAPAVPRGRTVIAKRQRTHRRSVRRATNRAEAR